MKYLRVGSESVLDISNISLSMPNAIPLLLMTTNIIGSWYLYKAIKSVFIWINRPKPLFYTIHTGYIHNLNFKAIYLLKTLIS